MPKKIVEYSVPLNILIRDDGTKEALIAIAYYRGMRGRRRAFAGPAREALGRYVKEFEAGLSETERRRYKEILQSVKSNRALQEEISQSGSSQDNPAQGAQIPDE